jgi:PAS domain S-box-containing protein
MASFGLIWNTGDSMGKAKLGYLGERAVLIMIGACLVVIACMVSLLVVDQKSDREQQIRARGISLARLLAGLPNSELVGEGSYPGMLQLVSFSQGSEDFAYAALVNAQGRPIAEVSSPGIIVPQAGVSGDPSAWLGERTARLDGDGRQIIEYFAPVFESGDLAGQIRLGFFAPGYSLASQQVPITAGLALLIFLLAPLFYYLLRREIRPLVAAGAELEALLKDDARRQITIGTSAPLGAFMERFNQFLDYSRRRIDELENDRGELVASAKLISYKKSRIELILQTLPDAVLALDDHGKIIYANDRVVDLLGATREQVLSRHPREWCSNPEVVEFLEGYESDSASQFMTDTMHFKLPQKTAKSLALNAYPLFSPHDGSTIHGTLVVVRDATRESLARENRADFVAHLGHELKTPLNTLLLYSEVLLDDTLEDEAQRIEAINTIRDEVERLVSLVNNMLSITKIEMGSIDLDKQRVRLADLLNDISMSLGRNADQHGMNIDISLPRDLGAVGVDKELMRVAINNLVSNAIKYSDAGSTIRIGAEDTESAVLITVEDNGIGIAVEDQARIFDKFYRSDDDRARTRGGHGLGLSLAKQIVGLHDGELSVVSEVGKGSTFTITLWKRDGLIREAI